ncbi:MAG: hypothetical protein R3C15_14285 [Thermoleophilia bacterium]
MAAAPTRSFADEPTRLFATDTGPRIPVVPLTKVAAPTSTAVPSQSGLSTT